MSHLNTYDAPATTAAAVYDASDPTRATGTAKLGHITQMQALFDWPGLYLMADSLDELLIKKHGVAKHGRRSLFPTSVMLAIHIGARVTGSQASILTLVRDPDVWRNKLAPVFAERDENQSIAFPSAAPNRDQIRYFQRRVLETDTWESVLQETFQRLAVGQAVEMGNLDPNAPVDWSIPSLRHAVIGDGVVVRPFSDVTQFTDPATGEILYLGSRAVTSPRLAPALTDLTEDGKSNLRGLNMVSLLTPTEHGWVILGTGVATGAEQWAALDLLDSVAAKTGTGAHTLLWDRVFTTWLTDYTMAKHRIRVVNKSVGTNQTSTATPTNLENTETLQRRRANQELERHTSEDHINRRLVEHGIEEDDKSHSAARYRTQVTHAWRQQDLYEMFINNEPQPLGISLYRATSASSVTGARNQVHRKTMEVVRSRFRRFGTHTHPGTEGPCTHELYVDDGALHTVEPDTDLGCLVKTATAECTSSIPRLRDQKKFGSTDTWQMPCPHGDFAFTTQWDPQDNRYTPATPKDDRHSPKDMVLNELRPISRSQAQQFADIANFRNGAESYNKWYEASLPNHGRAATLSREAQAFDYLAGACLRNAITWACYQHDED